MNIQTLKQQLADFRDLNGFQWPYPNPPMQARELGYSSAAGMYNENGIEKSNFRDAILAELNQSLPLRHWREIAAQVDPSSIRSLEDIYALDAAFGGMIDNDARRWPKTYEVESAVTALGLRYAPVS